MKKLNLIIIATVIASLAMSLVFIEPTTTEASSGVLPNATPSPRKIRKIPAPTPSPITKVKTGKSNIREGGANDTTFRTRKPKNNSTRTNAKQSTRFRPKKPLQFELFFDEYGSGGNVKAKKPAGFVSPSSDPHGRKKQPRKRSSAKRMHKP